MTETCDTLLLSDVHLGSDIIVRVSVATTNRRFQKMGHRKIVGMFLKTALNSWNEAYFLRDHQYWNEVKQLRRD